MATLQEIDDAVRVLREHGCSELALLKCTSAYPAKPAEMNLNRMVDMMRRFDVPCGLSDHTLGTTASIAAVAMGACILEKHFTLKRSDGGPDAAFSLEPDEFRQLVQAVRETSDAMGTAEYALTESEEASRIFRRSLFAVEAIGQGEAFTASNVRSIRPGYGLAPKYYREVLGKTAAHDIPRGTPLSAGDITGFDA